MYTTTMSENDMADFFTNHLTDEQMDEMDITPSCRYPRPCAHACCDDLYENVTITVRVGR